jgi:hypothetical protein
LKKKGSYLAVFKKVEGKPLRSKIYLETAHQSYREIALQNIFQLGEYIFAQGNRVAEKEGFVGSWYMEDLE